MFVSYATRPDSTGLRGTQTPALHPNEHPVEPGLPGLHTSSSSASGGLTAYCPPSWRWSGKRLDLSTLPADVSPGDGAVLICFIFVLFPAAAPLHLRRRLLFLTN